MEEPSKPLMRSLMYLHLNHTTHGSRAPMMPDKPTRHSSWLIVFLVLMVVYLLAALIITNGF
jgi:hypothetical protein